MGDPSWAWCFIICCWALGQRLQPCDPQHCVCSSGWGGKAVSSTELVVALGSRAGSCRPGSPLALGPEWIPDKKHPGNLATSLSGDSDTFPQHRALGCPFVPAVTCPAEPIGGSCLEGKEGALPSTVVSRVLASWPQLMV